MIVFWEESYERNWINNIAPVSRDADRLRTSAGPVGPAGDCRRRAEHHAAGSGSFPVLARHEGVWGGTFMRLDADHKVVAEFKSRIVKRFLPDEFWPEI
jgi:hypothetical protein